LKQLADAPETPAFLPPAAPENSAPQFSPAASAASAELKRGPWLRWGRWAMLGLVLLAGAGAGGSVETTEESPTLSLFVGPSGALVSVYVLGSWHG
jgi:hypothetical protein